MYTNGVGQYQRCRQPWLEGLPSLEAVNGQITLSCTRLAKSPFKALIKSDFRNCHVDTLRLDHNLRVKNTSLGDYMLAIKRKVTNYLKCCKLFLNSI